MAFTVQNDSGIIDGANAYITVAEFKDYHKDRGNDFSAFGSSDIQKAIIRATDHLDTRFRFVGDKQSVNQTTAWPRVDAEDIDEDIRTGIPIEVKEATAEYAFIGLSQALNAAPTREGTGQMVQRKRTKVGPIEKDVEFVSGGVFSLPIYPLADQKLKAAGLVIRGGNVARA
jgi:hypothetical protein